MSFRINKQNRRAIEHRIRLESGSIPINAWRLSSVDKKNNPSYSIVIPNIENISTVFSDKVLSEYRSFCNELNKKKVEWGFRHGTPTFKKAVRLYKTDEAFQHFHLQIVFHHFGAVPGLVVDEIEGMKLVLLPETFGRQGRGSKNMDEENLEILMSFESFLPQMFWAYYEQISNYFQSIFFEATDENVITLCLRIRHIVGESIGGKLKFIKDCSKNNGEISEKAKAVYKKHELIIREAEAANNFVYLLVNYIYRFYCIKDRVDYYHKKLKPLRGSLGLFCEDNIYFIKSCADNLSNPSDEFLGKLYLQKNDRGKWLYRLGEIAAFIAEIVRFTKDKPVDCPYIFLTYHFRVQDSERFVGLLKDKLERNPYPCVKLLLGRELGQNIRWSLLARIWFCDHHIFFLPHSWLKVTGDQKLFHREEDWVMLELIYNRLIKKEFTYIVHNQITDKIIGLFREHIEKYTNEKEISYASDIGWKEFVETAKKELSQHLHTHKYLTCNPEKFDEWFIDDKFQNVTEKASVHFIDVLFNAWCFWFNKEAWSIAQALIEMDGSFVKSKSRDFTINDLLNFICKERKNNEPYEWVIKCDTREKISATIRRKVWELKKFAFTLDGKLFYLLKIKRRNNKIYIKLRHRELYDNLIEKLGITDSNHYHWNKIILRLLRYRKH